jgi:hypothetical protein
MKLTNQRLKQIIKEETRKAVLEDLEQIGKKGRGPKSWSKGYAATGTGAYSASRAATGGKLSGCKEVSRYYRKFKPNSAYHKMAAGAAQRIYDGDGPGAEKALRGMVALVDAMKKKRKPGVDPEKVQYDFWDSVVGTYWYIADLANPRGCVGKTTPDRKFHELGEKVTKSRAVHDLLVKLMPLGTDPKGKYRPSRYTPS